MKFDPPLQEGILLKRYKRFLADVECSDGSVLTIHCPNTGSMLNCAEPGSRVWYSVSDNPARKYPNTWELVETGADDLAGINTGRANSLVEEALKEGVVDELADYEDIRREVRFGSERSRIDFLLDECPAKKLPLCYLEVKNVTLSLGAGLGVFPDAVTTRGQKHLRELIEVERQGNRAVLFFCVQHSGIEVVATADQIDPEYGRLLRKAASAGVELLAYRATLSPSAISLTKRIPIELS